MNNKHWEKFYKTKKPIRKPSSFAKFIEPFIHEKSIIYDLGSGNGRDSVFFAKRNFLVVSVDPHGEPYKSESNLIHWKMDINTFLKQIIPSKPSVIYSRFFIHAIDKKQAIHLISSVKKGMFFVAEFRIKGDEPVLYKDHKRTLWDEDEFKKLFNRKEWKPRFWISRGVAKYKNEDPLVMRVIAKRI